MGMLTDIKSLDPHYNDNEKFRMVFPVYDRLIDYDAQVQPKPSLAESWDISSDGKQYKLNLRRGVQFHSGREFTSDDVRFNIRRVADPKSGTGQLASMGAWFTDVQTPDKYTAILKMDQSYSGVFDLLVQLNIADKDTVPLLAAPTQVIGTGPFTFGEWVQGDHVTLNKNKNYWASGRPYLDRVIYRIFRDSQAQVASFEAGALDMSDSLPYTDVARLSKDSKYTFVADPPAATYRVIFNTTAAPLDKPAVRQALNFAIDRSRIASSIAAGYGDPGDLQWAETSPAFDASKNKRYAFDLDKARSLLKSAGIDNLELTFNYPNSSPLIGTLAQIYQADLAKIGVKLTISPVDNIPPLASTLKYQVIGIVSDSWPMRPEFVLAQNSVTRPTSNNWLGYTSPQYTQLLASMALETDRAKYKQLTSQLNDLLLDVSAVASVVNVRYVLASKSNFHGARRTFGVMLNLTDAWAA